MDDAARALGSDRSVPARSPLDQSWVVRPAALYRYSRLLGLACADGLYLTAWPRAAKILSLIAFLIGLGTGATHWTPEAFGVIGETGLYAGPFPTGALVTVFAQSIPFLVVVAVMGALSARAGVLLTLGYALGDYLIAGLQFGMPAAGYPVTIFGFSNPYLTAFCYVRVPQLLMYALLFLLAVMPTLATSALAQSLRPLGQYLGHARRLARRYVDIEVRVADGVPLGKAGAALLAVGRIILLCAVQWWFVYSWTLAAPMIFRIPWLWAGSPPPIPVFIFLAVIGGWVTNAAIAGMLLRGVLVLLANRNPAVRARAGRFLLAQADGERRRTRSPLPAWASSTWRSVALAAVIALLLSGYDSDPVVGIRVFAFAASMLVLRSPLLPLLPPWRLWMGVMDRIPAIIRLAAVAITLPALAAWYFLDAPGASVQANAATGSFGAQIVATGLGLLLLVVLLPGSGSTRSRGPEQEVAAGGRTGGRRVWGRRIALFSVSFMLLTVLFDLPMRADAACLDPHCCFNVDKGLAAIVVGGTVLLLSTLALIVFPPSAPGDIGGMDAGGGLVFAGVNELGGFDGLIATIRSAAGVGQAAGAGAMAAGTTMLMSSHNGSGSGSSNSSRADVGTTGNGGMPADDSLAPYTETGWQPGEPMPASDEATIDPGKFERYSMNRDNPQNGGKWIAWQRAGYDVESETGRQEATRDAIAQVRAHLGNAEATPSEVTQYGTKFEVDIPYQCPNGMRTTLKTVWQFDHGSHIAKMVTNYLKV